MYSNVQSLYSKINELNCTVSDYEPDILIFTETWLNSDINNSVISLTNYSIEHRLDRTDTTGGRGGGIIVYVKSGLNILVSDNNDIEFNQYCSFTISTKSDEGLNFVCFYRSPNSTPDNNNKLCEVVRNMRKNTIFVGDLNYPNIDWSDNTGDRKTWPFLDCVDDKFLSQCVDFPTHIGGNILDVILTDIPNRVLNIEDIGRIGKSDHVMILCDIRCDKINNESCQDVPDWKKADIQGAKDFLSEIDWHRAINHLNTDEAWSFFTSKIEETHSRFIPVKKRRNPKKPPWLTREITKKSRKKTRLWKKYKYSQSAGDLEEYKNCRKDLQKAIRSAKRLLEKRLSLDNKNQRSFNSYIKSKTANKTTVGPLKKSDGSVTSDNQEMATILNEFFTGVFTQENLSHMPSVDLLTDNSMNNVHFSSRMVTKKINKLKSGSAPGPDNISVKILQTFCNELAIPLSVIFNKSMNEGSVPEVWRKANVTPIFKKGKKSSAENYRPVSLTSIPCKIMESIIKDDMMAHFHQEEIIKPSQHGFVNNKSVTTNLLEFLELLTSELDNGEAVDVLYLDFSKAFDKVPKERLLLQFEAHGIKGRVLNWLRQWLTNRTQRVVLNGKHSIWSDVDSGVPQGSVMGPVGFVVYINPMDCKSVMQLVSALYKFADDTKCAKVIRSIEDNNKLQEAINKLLEWAETWSMQFNAIKCKIMHIGRNNPCFQYLMNGTILESTDEEKDVGVLIHKSLKPSKQCTLSAKKANQVLGQITRAFHYRDRHVFLRLYKQYVRCHLEFAVSVWSPWTNADIEVLEKVQMRAVNMISGLGGTYEEKLQELNLQSLADRRTRADMIQTYKILHGFDKVEYSTWFTLANTREITTRTTQDSLNLIKPQAKLDLRKNFFSHRVIDKWNSLAFELKRAKNPDQFKRKYDELCKIGSVAATGQR